MGFRHRLLHSTVPFSMALALACPLSAESGPTEKTPDLVAVTSSMSRGSFRSMLRPIVDVPLSSRAAGIIETIHVPEGSAVKAGQPIISLDSNQERADVLQAEAAMRGTKANMDRATSDFESMQRLNTGTENVYSEKALREAKAQAAVARSGYDQAAATLELARVRLVNRDVISPIDGIFLKTNKVVGEAVERYETVARVVDITSLEMVVYCDARFFSLFKDDQKVDVRVLKSAEDQPVVTGTVSHVDPIIDSSGTFRVKVRIEPSPKAVAGFPAILIAPAH
jgi:RND family efflux transporter MFP subunit